MMRHTQGLRLRPVPELAVCLAYTPRPPRLHTLNPSAWLIVELCRDARPLEAEFLRRTTPPLSRDDALAQLRDGLASLLEAGIIEPAHATSTAQEGNAA